MKLSEYIKRLQALGRVCQKKGIDPEVCIRRYSDLTTLVTSEPWDRNTSDSKPCIVRGYRGPEGQDWITREHASMSEDMKARLETFIELAEGN